MQSRCTPREGSRVMDGQGSVRGSERSPRCCGTSEFQGSGIALYWELPAPVPPVSLPLPACLRKPSIHSRTLGIVRRLNRLREEKRPIRFLLSRVLWKTGLVRWIPLYIDRGDYRIRFFPTSLSASYWLNPEVRRDDEQAFRRIIREGDTVVDVGANIGTLTLLSAALVGNSGTVVAIEPHPQIFGYLSRNIALNRSERVILHNTALGSRAGVVAFSDSPLDDQNRVDDSGGLKVDCTTLDELLGDSVAKINLLKIDVEGFEKPVLEGASGVLARTRHVIFEAYEPHFRKYGYSTADLLGLLSRAGFATFRIIGDQLVAIPQGFSATALENLLATREDT